MTNAIAIPGIALLLALPFYTVSVRRPPTEKKSNDSPSPLYAFKVKTIDGQERSLAEYRGKVLLIVNVASECGFTPQYAGLEQIYQKYRDRGFVILGFPSNDFGQQEPGTDAQIRAFCNSKYNVTFDMFSKIDVKGANQAPLYKYLTTGCESHHEISWNFNKFLVDRSGNVVNYFPSNVTPTDPVLTKKIEELLAARN